MLLNEEIKFDSVIFDMDGTLWNCSEASAIGYNLAYKHFGIDKEVDADFVMSFSGQPASEYNSLLLDGVSEEYHKELLELLDKKEAEKVKELARESLYPGVEIGIKELSKKIKIYVVSNCGIDYMDTFINYSGLRDYISDYESYGNTEESKAKNILSVIERNNLRSSCYVGDTSGDETAAMEVGIPFFYVKYGFGTPEFKHKSFDNFYDLTKYFNERTINVSRKRSVALCP